MNSAGFDTYAFPGADNMTWLKANTNLAWCGFYLAPAPSHPDTSWMVRRATLMIQGWGLAPVYLGQQSHVGPGSHNATAAQGSLDGTDAASLMRQATFPEGSCCYLDIEAPDPTLYPYVLAWAAALTEAGFRPGVYCSHEEAADILKQFKGVKPIIWAYRVATIDKHDVEAPFSEEDPAVGSGCKATAWQHDQNAVIDVDGEPLLVDLSTASVVDPSQP